MTNSQKSVKIGPDGADFFCDNSMNHEKKKSSIYRRRLRLSSWWNWTFKTTNIVLQKSQHNLYGSNIWKGSIRPFFLTELIEKCSFCPLQIWNGREIYLKYLDTDKMRGKVSKSEMDAFNGP